MTTRRHGCHGRPPLRLLVEVQDGWRNVRAAGQSTRVPVMRFMPDPMTKACQYATSPEGQADPACEGCRNHASGAIILQYTPQPVNEKEKL